MGRCGREPPEDLGKGVAAVPPPLASTWPVKGTPPAACCQGTPGTPGPSVQGRLKRVMPVVRNRFVYLWWFGMGEGN